MGEKVSVSVPRTHDFHEEPSWYELEDRPSIFLSSSEARAADDVKRKEKDMLSCQIICLIMWWWASQIGNKFG